MQNILSDIRNPRALQRYALILLFIAVLVLPRIEIAEADSSASAGDIQSEQTTDIYYPTPTNIPTATDTPIPTNTPGYSYGYNTPTPMPTPTATPISYSPLLTPTPAPATGDILYISSSTGGKADGIRFADEDILAIDSVTGSWSMYFDGSDVGLKKHDVNAFHVLDNGDILMSFNKPFKAAGTIYDDSDIAYFAATSLGTNTAGSFSMYLDGSDVQLTKGGEDIDAIAIAPNGDLVISTLGNAKVNPNIKVKDDDLLRLENGSFGDNTSGTWHFHFDGSDVGFTKSVEDISAAWIDANTQAIHLSTLGNYSVNSSGTNLSGDSDDVFICAPSSLGNSTQCVSSSVDDSDSIEEEEENDTSDDDVLDEEDITSRIYLPMINR